MENSIEVIIKYPDGHERNYFITTGLTRVVEKGWDLLIRTSHPCNGEKIIMSAEEV